MPDLLLELRSEEIPARMQRKAAGDLRKLVTDGLVEAGLTYEGCQEYWTPRRLTLDVRGLTARSRDVNEEIKGPSTKAPEQAVQGFLRKAGLADIGEAHVHSDPKKGDFYVAHIVKPGRAAEEIVAALLPGVIRDFPWPKSMRWGKASAQPGSLRWVRPLQSIVCTFGPETSEPAVIDFEVDGIRAGDVTYGHRFHAPGPITVRRFEDYATKLEAAKVILDAERRKKIIQTDAQNLAFAGGLELVEDEALLEEVSGLVEWPVVLMGEFEEAFLEIPAEVIRLTIRANQKCFVTRPAGAQGALSNRFIPTANIDAKDGGREIAYGNGKVVRARLSDALYFWKTDQGDLPDLDQLEVSAEKFGLKRDASGKLLPLDQRMARLDHLGVTFHAKLGTQGQRVERIVQLAGELAPIVAKAFSPLAGEMGGSPEGVVSGGTGNASSTAEVTPPGRPASGHPPRKGEGRPGSLLIHAWPDRVAMARGERGRFVLSNGRGAMLDAADPLAGEKFLVVADLQGKAQNARITSAAAVGEDDIRAALGARIERATQSQFDLEKRAVRVRETERLGAIVLAERLQPAPKGEAADRAVIAALREHGVTLLPWSNDTEMLRHRLEWLHRGLGAPWPDVSDAALAATLDDWLLPFLSGEANLARIDPSAIRAGLLSLVPHDLQRRIDALAPTHFDAPSGSRVPIGYEGERPVLSIRVQELFGLGVHPSIANGTVPLTLELLSPAHRPIQTTQDLPGFWRGSWADVRSDMRGRYPKHVWPDDPLNAAATSRAKPRVR